MRYASIWQLLKVAKFYLVALAIYSRKYRCLPILLFPYTYIKNVFLSTGKTLKYQSFL